METVTDKKDSTSKKRMIEKLVPHAMVIISRGYSHNEIDCRVFEHATVDKWNHAAESDREAALNGQ